jgi:hypothetical protein
MPINLLENVQIDMGYPPLLKIDPNLVEVMGIDRTPCDKRFSQAAIPATLTVLYKYSRTDEGAGKILVGNILTDWSYILFGKKRKLLFHRISVYSYHSPDNTNFKMKEVAEKAVFATKRALPDNASFKEVKILLSSQRINILPYLPAVLRMSRMLEDDTLDNCIR